MTNNNYPTIYPVSIDGKHFEDSQSKSKLHYFYLDGQAEMLNGYDICLGNIEALSMAMNSNVFEAILIYPNGDKKGCKVWSYYDRDIKRMRGYVWLQNDETVAPFISRALDKSEVINTSYTVDKEGKIHFLHEKRNTNETMH